MELWQRSLGVRSHNQRLCYNPFEIVSYSLARPHIFQSMDPAACTNVMSLQAGTLESTVPRQEQGAQLPESQHSLLLLLVH